MKYYETINKLIKDDKITFKEACDMIESVVSELIIPIVRDEVRKQVAESSLNRIWRQGDTISWPTTYPNTPGDSPISPVVMYGVSSGTGGYVTTTQTNDRGFMKKLKNKIESKLTASISDNQNNNSYNSDFPSMTVNGNQITWSKDKQINS